MRGQRSIHLDSSINRSFPIGREKQFQFHAEAFSLFNHPSMTTREAPQQSEIIWRDRTYSIPASYLRQNQSWCGLIAFVQGRRSLMVATTYGLCFRDTVTLVLL
jgi:hypothetical protein